MLTFFKQWIGLALMLFVSASHAHVLSLDERNASYVLGSFVEYLEDASGRADFSSIKQSVNWKRGETPALNFGFTDSAYWVRLPLYNGSNAANWLFQAEYALLDDVELYVEHQGQLINYYRAGNALAFAERPIKHRTFVFPLPLQPNRDYMLYARFAGKVSVQLPLMIWEERAFWQQDQRQNLLQGLYFGVLCIMAVYNLFLYFSLREKVHLIYVLMVCGVMMFMLAFRGIGYTYLWTNHLWWNERVISFIIPFANGCFVWFANEFLHARQLAPRLYRVQTSFMMISFLLAAASLLLEPNRLTPLNSAWVLISFVGIGFLSSALLMRDRAARFFAAAYLIFIYGGIVLALSKFGLIEYSFTSENSLQLGSILEAFLLSIAIGERIRMLQAEKMQAMHAEMLAREEAFQLAEREMRSQMESRAKSEFLASMSHEIRTPMNGVLGIADLLKETPLNDQQREYLTTLSNSGRSLLTVINDILDYSKVEAGKISLDVHEFDLHELVEETVSLFVPQIKKSGVKLFAHLDDAVPRKWCGDSHRLRQVLLNLLGNAFKFTEHGAVKLSVRLEPSGALLCFEVLDTGLGLSKEQCERLFQSYNQADASVSRKYGGTGLGLAISKRLVELMEGEIGVNSTLGVGSCFWFTVRLTAASNGHAEMAGTEQFSTHIIVSSDAQVKLNLRQQLQQLGGLVICVDSLREFHHRAAGFPSPIKSIFVQTEEGLSDAFMHAVDALKPEKVVILGHHQGSATSGRDDYLFLPYPITTQRIGHIFDNVRKDEVARKPAVIRERLQLRVLVAEDNKVNQLVIRGMLRQLAIEPVVVENGHEALTHYQNAPDEFDLILMDCEMPEMDGYQAASAIRRWEQHQGLRPVPISALTAHILEEHRQQAEQAGMDHYLAKPIDKEALLRVLRLYAPEMVS